MAADKGPLQWLATQLKRPFGGGGGGGDGEQAGPAGEGTAGAKGAEASPHNRKDQRNRFWKTSPNKLPGTVRKQDAEGGVREAAPAAGAGAGAGASGAARDRMRSEVDAAAPAAAGALPAQAGAPSPFRRYPIYSASDEDVTETKREESSASANARASGNDASPPSSNSRRATHHASFSAHSLRAAALLQPWDGAAGAATASSPVATPAAPAAPAAAAAAAPADGESPAQLSPSHRKRLAKLQRFKALLEEENANMDALRELSWSGVNPEVRPIVWQLLLGYLPANRERRKATLEKRRLEYVGYVAQTCDAPPGSRTDEENKTHNQILIDVPRTSPGLPMFQSPLVQKSLERILYVWAIRHPASGYVQGINDIVTPLLVVFLCDALGIHEATIEAFRSVDANVLKRVTKEKMDMVEADCFWCLSKLLDGIQDLFTFAQPGLQKRVFKLQELIHRIDLKLHDHLDGQGFKFIHFAFRWINCLLLREFPLPLIIRAWDSYLAEPNENGFKTFHVYVCAALLTTWSKDLVSKDFQELALFMQALPTQNWTQKDMEALLAQAYVYMSLYEGAPKHLA
jgi:hypothetical protein